MTATLTARPPLLSFVVRRQEPAMSFRLWFYLAKVVAPLLFGAVFLKLALPDNVVVEALYRPALYSLIALGILGGVLGLLLAFGRLLMRCPFCGQYGAVGGSKAAGLWLDCTTCGLVHGAGPFGLLLVHEKTTVITAEPGAPADGGRGPGST